MLENLTQRMAHIAKRLRGEAQLTEDNMRDMLREIRIALLEADVALPVVKDFLANIQTLALGEKVLSSLSPGQALVGIVQRELTKLMGGNLDKDSSTTTPGINLNLATATPAIILLAGLQGAGKTTTAGKLAKLLKDRLKRKVLTVSCDVYRPAAIEQLKIVSKQAQADWFASTVDQTPIDIARAAVDWARRQYHDVLIVDTAGRLGIDSAMMDEIANLQQSLNPVETLFVVDAMQGQDAVNTAKAFNDRLNLTGIILSKLDGDARGGAALSVHQVVGQPIKFIGISEKIEGIEPFYPDRMADRILGMGDIFALVEEAQRNVDERSAKKLADKVKSGGLFDLNDFMMQIVQMNKMGGIASLLDKLPMHLQQAAAGNRVDVAEKQMRRMQGMVNSMTPEERSKPELIKASRKRRIAKGAGVTIQDLNRMLAQFEQMRDMVKKLKKGGMSKMMRSMRGMLPGMR